MQKSVFFRRILILLLVALLMWTILTALVYSFLSKPVFTRIKVDELRPKAESIAVIAAASFVQDDPYFDTVLRSAFDFFDAWVFIVDGLTGEIRNTSLPAELSSFEPDIHDQINHQVDTLLSGSFSSLWFSRRLRGSGDEMLFVGVPVNMRFGSQNNVVGAVFFVKPLEELSVGLRNLNIALLFSSLAVFLLMIIPTYLATARLILPLRQTRNVALALYDGDFSVRADSHHKGEIGELARTMNNLAGKLSGTISDLVLERNRLRQIIEGMREGLIAVDTNLNITQVNQTAASLLSSLIQNEARADNISRLMQEAGLEKHFLQALEENQEVIAVFNPRKDKHVQIHIVPLLDSSEKIAGAVALLRDISETERLEQTRRDYVANISHELRTPLTSMRALLEPLKDDMVKDDQDRQRYYSILLRETVRLSRLIDDMLQLSRIQAGTMPMQVKQMHLQQIISDLMLKYANQAEDLEIQLHPPENLDQCPEVISNADRIEQVLIILLDNALKFTSQEGNIYINLDWDDKTVYITVRDTGTGIDPDDLEHVFDRFYKADKAHGQPGTGLGLAIAREILQAMDQKIEVESTLGQGTSFRLTLPRAI